MKELMALPQKDRDRFVRLLRDLRAQSNEVAETAWKRRKAPMAFYFRVVSTNARHIAHAMSKGADPDPGGVAHAQLGDLFEGRPC